MSIIVYTLGQNIPTELWDSIVISTSEINIAPSDEYTATVYIGEENDLMCLTNNNENIKVITSEDSNEYTD